MKWGQALLDLLFPVCCPGCGTMTDAEHPWCEACVRQFWNPRMIQSAHSRDLEGCYTCCQYTAGIRDCIIQLKYYGKKNLKRCFPMLLARFPWWERLASYPIAVPVPLSRRRRESRGYNQCDLIFQDFMKNLGKTYDAELLVRLRDTKVQSTLDREERRKNIRDAFHINRGRRIEGQCILLLDDVYTTGATMEEAARELKRAGAAAVMGLTLASGAP